MCYFDFIFFKAKTNKPANPLSMSLGELAKIFHPESSGTPVSMHKVLFFSSSESAEVVLPTVGLNTTSPNFRTELNTRLSVRVASSSAQPSSNQS